MTNTNINFQYVFYKWSLYNVKLIKNPLWKDILVVCCMIAFTEERQDACHIVFCYRTHKLSVQFITRSMGNATSFSQLPSRTCYKISLLNGILIFNEVGQLFTCFHIFTLFSTHFNLM